VSERGHAENNVPKFTCPGRFVWVERRGVNLPAGAAVAPAAVMGARVAPWIGAATGAEVVPAAEGNACVEDTRTADRSSCQSEGQHVERMRLT